MTGITLIYKTSIPLLYSGDCNLLAVAPDLTVFVEEVYTDEAWIAQHAITLDGQILQSVDEQNGAQPGIQLQPLTIPPGSSATQTAWHTMKKLNFTGPRHRGMREAERIADMVQPLTIQDKMALINHLDLKLMPPMLLGIAESYVLAEAEIVRPSLFIVCRRIRLAYALATPRQDDHHQLYDYDTRILYLAHWVDRHSDTEPALTDLLDSLPGVTLHRPMDCIVHGDYLFVADGGESSADRKSQIHVWDIQRPPVATSIPD